MISTWPGLPYEKWRATCDTLHGHTQVLGKLAVALAPPQPQLQHTALRLGVRGWETLPLPAPDGSGAFAVTLDLRTHEAVVEHSDGRVERIALTPDRAVGEITRAVLAAVARLVGPVEIDPTPQETSWKTPLDEDDEHATYNAAQVADYFLAATRAALVLSEVRAPYRGRSTPVNAWWGSFDLAVVLFSGRPADPPSQDFIMRNSMDAQEIEVGWWPGDERHRKGGVLRLCASGTRRVFRRHSLAGGGPMGRDPRRVHPRLGRHPRERRSARGSARVRTVGDPARVRGLRLGSRARRERRGGQAADRLMHHPRSRPAATAGRERG